MHYIDLSIFEFFKVGPGPSSSHTIGPMTAGGDFRCRLEALSDEDLNRGLGLRAVLYGSLSATGKGHGTDRALTAGIMGLEPEDMTPEYFSDLWSISGGAPEIRIRHRIFPWSRDSIEYGPATHGFPFSNTVVLELTGPEKPILKMVYYSVGGGFIQWDGYERPAVPPPPYRYSTMSELCDLLINEQIGIGELMSANEMVLSGADKPALDKRLDKIIRVMTGSVERGLRADGFLPGPIGLVRKAGYLFDNFSKRNSLEQDLIRINSYALAAAEENAAGGIVCTAPTLGSAGVIPALLYYLKRDLGIEDEKLRLGLKAAAAIGFIIKHNASIAGAEVGCQGEIGSASAMAAGFLAGINGESPQVMANAAEIALEHHLGLTCDPVLGYVQIPCIERNAMGAIKAYNAYLLASAGDAGRQKVSFDQVVKAMLDTGKDMSEKYKETSLGGLAVSLVQC